MKQIKLTKTNHNKVIDQAVKTLKNGGLVIYPTETCYGAGVDATNQKAVDKLLSYKTRREGKPLSIAVTSKSMASNYVKLNPSSINLYDKFLPGPLTVVSRGLDKVAKGVQSETKTLGIRIPDYPLILDIVKNLGKPITATSANVSYKKRPYSVKDILNNTSQKQQSLINLVIDAGTLPTRPSSTVVDTTLDDPLILRQGKIDSIKSKKTLTTKAPQETSNLAKTIILKHLKTLKNKPLLILLTGDLGAGKTQFTKGIGEFLNLDTPITSPTYTILKDYNYTRHSTKGKLVHLDTWRIHHLKELEELNLSKYFKPNHIIAIEWADRTLTSILKLAKTKKAKIININLKPSSVNQEHRLISIS